MDLKGELMPGRAALLSALAVAVAIADAVVIATGHRNSATDDAGNADLFRLAAFKLPVLRDGVLTILGTRGADKITLRLKRGHPGVLQIDVGNDGSADFSFKRRLIRKIVVNARAGNDRVRINERNGVFTNRIPTTLAGGDGSDALVGGSGGETLLGGVGSDSIDANRGNDAVRMGAGDDTFVWNPGDGNDVVEGGIGADVLTVDDLTGTGVSSVQVELGGGPIGVGDGEPDRVVVNGTDGIDAITVTGDVTELKVSGLAATVVIFQPEAANDRLEINTLAGRDTVDSAGSAPGAIQLLVDGVVVF
jgi:hypothetical protein